MANAYEGGGVQSIELDRFGFVRDSKVVLLQVRKCTSAIAGGLALGECQSVASKQI
jgi:hypothetical protein